MTDISLDIETLSTRKNAVVLSIGACEVGNPQNCFYKVLEMQDQLDKGRHISQDTLHWWLLQAEDARKAFILKEHLGSSEALTELIVWLEQFEDPLIWTKGPSFDGAILESLAEDFGRDPPFHFRSNRDVRTLIDIVGRIGTTAQKADLRLLTTTPFSAHNALADAQHQASIISFFFREFS